MSKLWSIPERFLDDKRLLRQHQSVHKLLTECTKKFDGSQNRFYKFGGYLVWRHYLAVSEMRLRGLRHESFVDQLWKQIPVSRRLMRYTYPRKQIVEDYKLLRSKQHYAGTTASSYGREQIRQYDIRSDELNEACVVVAREGLPRDVFVI